jgi:hypothetical protein
MLFGLELIVKGRIKKGGKNLGFISLFRDFPKDQRSLLLLRISRF